MSFVCTTKESKTRRKKNALQLVVGRRPQNRTGAVGTSLLISDGYIKTRIELDTIHRNPIFGTIHRYRFDISKTSIRYPTLDPMIPLRLVYSVGPKIGQCSEKICSYH